MAKIEPKEAHLAGMDIIWEIFGNLDQVLIPLKMEITIPIHQVRYFSNLICFYLNEDTVKTLDF